jgi:hypothetical protein
MSSLLSSSLSWVQHCYYSSSITINIAAAPGGENLHPPATNDQHHHEKQAQTTADLFDNKARSGPMSILAR